MSDDLNPQEFDVLGTIKGVTYPTKDVVIYLDQESAHEIAVLEQRIADTEDPKVVNELDERINELRAKIEATALTFHLRGIGRGVRAAVDQKVKEKKGLTELQKAQYSNAAYLAEHIIRVTNAKGDVNEQIWNADQALALLEGLPDETAIKFLEAMGELTFQAAYFDAAVSADFLPKS